MDSYDILVIILSIFLAIFLLLSIIVCVLLIRTIRRVNELVTKAEDAVGQAGKAAQSIVQLVAPASVVRSITKYFKKLSN